MERYRTFYIFFYKTKIIPIFSKFYKKNSCQDAVGYRKHINIYEFFFYHSHYVNIDDEHEASSEIKEN